jgi:hypothetical protein
MHRVVRDLRPASSSWRTWRTSSLSTTEPSGEKFSGTWPRSGTTRNGTAFRLPPLAPRTSVTGFCALLPTAASGHRRPAEVEHDGAQLRRRSGSLRRRHEPQRVEGVAVEWGEYEPAIRRWEAVHDLRLSPWFVEWMMGAPEGWSDPDCPLSATEFSSRQAARPRPLERPGRMAPKE